MSNKTILAIDDDKKFLKVLSDALTPCGFDVLTADNGAKGIQIFKKDKPDLILLDALLPRMDGFQVCEEIRQEPEGEEIPIIMMTAVYKMPEKEREAKVKYKVREYLSKPIDLKDLLTAIHAHIN